MRYLLAFLLVCLPFTVLAQTVEPGPLAEREITTTVQCEWPEYLDYTAASGSVYRYPAPAFDTGCDAATDPHDPGHTDPVPDPTPPPTGSTEVPADYPQPPELPAFADLGDRQVSTLIDQTTADPFTMLKSALVQGAYIRVDGVMIRADDWLFITVPDVVIEFVNGGGIIGGRGDESLVRAARDVDNLLIRGGTLACDGAKDGFYFYPQGRAEVVLDGVQITGCGNGIFTAVDVDDPGGELHVRNSNFTGNGRSFSGGSTHSVAYLNAPTIDAVFRNSRCGPMAGDGNALRVKAKNLWLIDVECDMSAGGSYSKLIDYAGTAATPADASLVVVGGRFVHGPNAIASFAITPPRVGTAGKVWMYATAWANQHPKSSVGVFLANTEATLATALRSVVRDSTFTGWPHWCYGNDACQPVIEGATVFE